MHWLVLVTSCMYHNLDLVQKNAKIKTDELITFRNIISNLIENQNKFGKITWFDSSIRCT